MPLLGTDGVLPVTLKPLFSVGHGRDSFNRINRSSAEGDHLGSERNVGVAVDRGECDKISGFEDICIHLHLKSPLLKLLIKFFFVLSNQKIVMQHFDLYNNYSIIITILRFVKISFS